ncbi:MAG: isovaleryl-CoA dehydrogenase [Bdellovibrionales bacterium CG10_big_fil_rev_8_21_14_0_10_45_34]|nr:MAG: isovaleryl-CoA dehydrogenase [Bdellovibrionales bacterium CG10_big_fil_rev_8_21_14_0_10_45_34]
MDTQYKEMDLYNPTDEHKMLRETVRSFVQAEVEPQAQEYDSKEIFNLDLFRKLGELGLLGITADPNHGGSGMDALAAVIAHEELSAADPGFCLAYLAHSMLFVNNLSFNGSEEQKQKFLPRLCSGEHVGAMAMSEPAVGTDVLAMETTAKKEGDHYILQGRKMWITNGTIDESRTPCDLVWVYAKTGEIDGRPLLSTFIVERGFPGFSVGQKIKDKLGMRASNTAELVFESCKVPSSHLIGQEGDSLGHMMKNLEIERVTLAAMGVGIARRCVEIMNKYANERMAFGQRLNQFGQIQSYIAESFAEYRAMKAYVYETARMMDLTDSGNRLDSDGVKLIASKGSKAIADRAIQVLGGYGYVGEYVVERLWRDAKLLEIGGGTIEAHQKNIARDLIKFPSLL